MKNVPQKDTEYVEYEDMFDDITDISWSKNIAPFSTDVQEIITSGKKHHVDENMHLKDGRIRPSTRTLIMHLPIQVHTKEGKNIDIDCKIWSRTMQNLVNTDIVKNIRAAWSLDILDIDFEFALGGAEFSEYSFGEENFYTNIKDHTIEFIKNTPWVEQAIIDNYCDGLDATLSYITSKEWLVRQREKTTRDLFESFGMPKSFVLSKSNKVINDGIVFGSYGGNRQEMLWPTQQKKFKQLIKIGNEFSWFDAAYETKRYIEDMKKEKEDIDKIVTALQNKQQEVSLDSKFFFLDNGDNLYDDVIEKSAYNRYYKEELMLIQKNKEKIAPYLKQKYIGLWCWNGKKDYNMISENIDTDSSPNKLSSWSRIGKVVLMDSSLKSLSKAEKLISKNRWNNWVSLGSTIVVFSQERIDTLLQDNEIKALTSVTYNPKETKLNIPDIKETSNTFTLFGWTFGNFLGYKKIFLRQMNKLMNVWDVLCVSVFNPPTSKQEQETIVSMYDTPETHMFIKNFFIKLGIPKEAIEIKVWYSSVTHTINIDAKIHRKDNQPIVIHPTGKDVTVADGTVFHCIASQRMDETNLQKDIKQSQTSLKIIDRISTPDNSFTLYMISK